MSLHNNPAEKPVSIARSKIAFKTLVRRGCEEDNDPRSCHKYAEYVEIMDKDFKTAAEIYKSNCEKGKFGKSCMSLGQMHYDGKPDIQKDEELGIKLFIQGCDLGCEESCNSAGQALIEGYPEKAVSYFKMACDEDLPVSCSKLGCIYLKGRDGVPQDKEKALKYCLTACDLGYIYGCLNASRMLAKGDGVPIDLAKAERLRKIVIEHRHDLKADDT